MERKVLLIYTGGTIGMVKKEDGSFGPFNFGRLAENVPELGKLPVHIDHISYEEPIDSSNMSPKRWIELATLLFEKREQYDGFVVLHGSDTMAYTASAVSFLLKNFNKPIVFTGSQLPIGIIRTDAKENLLTSIEIASTYENDEPLVPETALYFEYRLYRGNRTVKVNAELFNAFLSPNYPKLAEAGVHLNFNRRFIADKRPSQPELFTEMSTDVAILKLYPGISQTIVEAVLNTPNLKGLIMETFGTGNASTDKWFIDLLDTKVKEGLFIVNTTQCISGSVDQGRYETSTAFNEIGIIPADDMTTEAALTKLMFILANVEDKEEQIKAFQENLRGEKHA